MNFILLEMIISDSFERTDRSECVVSLNGFLIRMLIMMLIFLPLVNPATFFL